MKKIVLTGISAIEAWDIGLCAQARPVERLDLSNCAVGKQDRAGLNELVRPLTRPLHVLSSGKGMRRNSREFQCHVLTREVPRHSYFEIGEETYVEAPYLYFAQRAGRLSLSQACLLGMELCGNYSTLWLHGANHRIGDSRKGALERPPLASVERLERYAHAYGLGRKSMALRACKVLAEGARSPRESALHLLLQMDGRHGGYAQSGYQINARVPLAPEFRALMGEDTLEVDFLWRNHAFALEYDGRDWHADDRQRAYDNMRRSVLREMGIDVLVVDKWQMGDLTAFDAIMQMVADRAGGPSVRHDAKSRDARMELRAQLLAPRIDLYR